MSACAHGGARAFRLGRRAGRTWCPPGARVLDVACGSGRHVRWFAARGCARHRRRSRRRGARAAARHRRRASSPTSRTAPWPLAGRALRRGASCTNYLWRPLLPAHRRGVDAGRRADLRDLRRRQRDRRQAVATRTSCCARANCCTPCAGLRVVAYEDGFLDAPARFVQRIAAVREAAPAHAAGAAPLRAESARARRRLESRDSQGTLHETHHRQHRGARHADARRRQRRLRRAAQADRLAHRRRHATASASSARPANRRRWTSRSTARSSASRSSRRAAACRSWPAPAPIRPPRRSSCREFAQKVGADCPLQVVPYYNKPTQEGHVPALQGDRRGGATCRWCSTTCPAAPSPICCTTPCCGWPQVPGIVGIKEATGNIERAQWLIREAPKGFSVYSGDDGTAVALMLSAATATSASRPTSRRALMHELCMAALAGDARDARWRSSCS